MLSNAYHMNDMQSVLKKMNSVGDLMSPEIHDNNLES